MITHLALQLAIRARLRTLEVVGTGTTTLAAQGTTYTRSAGSFLDDGFAPGMELRAEGFGGASSGLSIVTRVQETVLTVDRAVGSVSAAGGRSLSVGLPDPSRAVWENADRKPELGKPYVREQYIPGPSRQVTVGPGGALELQPMYAIHVYVPADLGLGAHATYADAILRWFPPRFAIAVDDHVLRVRSDTGPFRGQLLRGDPGWVTTPVTIPFWVRTPNPV